MTVLLFDVEQFRTSFPAFANDVTFPDDVLQMYWDMSTCYIDDNADYGWLQGTCRRLALNLMTAHLTALSVLIAAGETPGYTQNATIDKVTVGLTPPVIKNQWQWWLISTPYGTQLLALLQARAVGGFYVGSLPELAAFRRVGGLFLP